MNIHGIGPRVRDLSCWEGANRFSVFAVEHLEGSSPTIEECQNFLRQLEDITKKSYVRILVPDWHLKSDFTCPSCNGNLLSTDKGLQYIDFQNFGITDIASWQKEIISNSIDDFHFGSGRPGRGRKYLYQTIPGLSIGAKRNTLKRWSYFYKMFRYLGLDLNRRIILDVGCNAGIMLYSSLVAGSGWCFGWDRPNVIKHTNDLLSSLGATRYSLFGAELHEDYDLEEDINRNCPQLLDESIVFYLSIRQHVGMLKSLESIPWKVFVYEGHQGETIHELPDILDRLLAKQNVQQVITKYFADGDSAARPLSILVRN